MFAMNAFSSKLVRTAVSVLVLVFVQPSSEGVSRTAGGWASAALGSDPRICIDPGHGGVDSGAVGVGGLLEKDVNLDVALRFADLLERDTDVATGGGAWQVLLTRDDDSTVSLQTRVDLANAWPADRFMSIHANGFTSPAANGTETFSFAEGTIGADLRDRIQDEMLAAWGLTDRGTKTAGFFVLVNTTMPATLSELGFMTSPIDIVQLADPEARYEAALAHLFALQDHYGIPPFSPYQPPTAYCTGKVNSQGCTPQIGSSGAPTRRIERICELGVMGRVARIVHNTRSPLPGVEGDPALAEHMRKELPGALRVLDDEVGGRPFLAGEHPSIADCTLFGTWEFGRLFGFEFDPAYENLHRWHADFLQRPSVSWDPDPAAGDR